MCSLPFKQRLSPGGLNLAAGSSAREGGWSQVTLGQQRGPWVPSPQHLLLGQVHPTPPLPKPSFHPSSAGAADCWRATGPFLSLASGRGASHRVPETSRLFFPPPTARPAPHIPGARRAGASLAPGLARTSQDGEGLPPARPALPPGLQRVKGALSPGPGGAALSSPGAT